MEWLLKRLREPTTYLGLAALTTGAGQLGKINEAPAVADALMGAGQAVAGGVDPMTAALMSIAGVLGVFMREKGDD